MVGTAHFESRPTLAVVADCDKHVQKPVRKNFRKSLDELEDFCRIKEVLCPTCPTRTWPER
ncbi:MAG: hypothetical protein CM1200mP2_35070 [Planctomycetaceae bacterium]|nr:MAG: hypothetical protein CM1200mP2_35070 [Planctomycetaceae bacterium]